MTEGVSKFLWLVSFDSLKPRDFLNHAKACGAQGVCIRTSNPDLPATVAALRESGLKVYGWRWPATANSPHGPPHYFALDEARFVVENLIPAGLDGYIVDPESDHAGDANDWNHEALAPLAREFCRIIRDGAASAGNPDFKFGVTSGVNFPSQYGKPHIPWDEFITASHAVYPQSYWRWRRAGDGRIEDLHGGRPESAVALGNKCWSDVCSGKPIIPMAGELDVITPREIAAYGSAAMKAGGELHFYADTARVPHENYRAIARIRAPAILVKAHKVHSIPPVAKVKPVMTIKNSEARDSRTWSPDEVGRTPNWMGRFYRTISGAYWVMVTLMSLIVILQAAWPQIISDPSSWGGVAQAISETLFDRPAAVRQSALAAPAQSSPGFLGYLYFDGRNCKDDPAGIRAGLAFPCRRDISAGEMRFQKMQILRISAEVEVREHPWPEAQLMAVVRPGQCVELVANAVGNDTSSRETLATWLPVRRIECPG